MGIWENYSILKGSGQRKLAIFDEFAGLLLSG